MGSFLVVSLALDGDIADFARFHQDAEAAGLKLSSLGPRCWLGVAGPDCPSTTVVGPWTLIGDVFNRNRPPVGRVADDDPHLYEKKLMARFWGRYVGVRLDASGGVTAILRDPSGALDCVCWTQGAVTLVASEAPDWLLRTRPPSWTINRDRVQAALHDPFLAEADLLLDGPSAVTPGTMRSLTNHAITTLWRPDWIARAAPAVTDDTAGRILRNAVDEVVDGHARLGGVLAAEMSGGLDSSIVAATLARRHRDQTALWLNAWGPDASGDERPWARLLASHIGVDATCVPRATGRVTTSLLESMPQGFRPGLAALDGLHDADWAGRFRQAGVERVLTGKGGDALFIQPADIGVFVDLWRRRGWRALTSPSLLSLARWNERSIWSLIAAARRPRFRSDEIDAPNGLLSPLPDVSPAVHPWMEGIADLGPAKRRQILGLVQGVGFHGPSLQTRASSVIHPLLAQPVVEACLALSTPQLTLGHRDRGLARQAFLDRLPPKITERRSKGEMTAFYGHMIADGLDALRPWLLDGRLAAMGLIDRPAAEALLTRESLAWRGGYVDIMTTAAIEGWVRAWETRLQPR